MRDSRASRSIRISNRELCSKLGSLDARDINAGKTGRGHLFFLASKDLPRTRNG